MARYVKECDIRITLCQINKNHITVDHLFDDV